ncbi:hypothetical protein Btru_040776 [Bulinus truncatus]|nr:hypothetical protein Btru_040776 [Bulinus truncatus]
MPRPRQHHVEGSDRWSGASRPLLRACVGYEGISKGCSDKSLISVPARPIVEELHRFIYRLSTLRHQYPQTLVPSNSSTLRKQYPQAALPSDSSTLRQQYPQTAVPSDSSTRRQQYSQTARLSEKNNTDVFQFDCIIGNIFS